MSAGPALTWLAFFLGAGLGKFAASHCLSKSWVGWMAGWLVRAKV